MRSMVAAAFLLATTGAQALDGGTLVYGQGNNVSIYGAELRSAQWRQWQVGRSWQLGLYGIGSIAYWHAREDSSHPQLWDFGVAPVLRLQRLRAEGPVPYFEASLGVHLLSQNQINGEREFATAFQFGEFLGAGLAFGKTDISLRLQHVSNGGIKNPNPGLTFVSVALGQRF